MSRRLSVLLLFVLTLALVPLGLSPAANSALADADRYRNPLKPVIPAPRGIPGDIVESCADPVVLRGRGEDRRRWYMFCTTDPLNDAETAPPGPPPFHPIPMLVSRDLVNWRYVGDALPNKPAYADEDSLLWAPDIVYSRATDRYYLTFVVTDTARAFSGVDCGDVPGPDGVEPVIAESSIGVATSRNPTGPWKFSKAPVVLPRKDPNSGDPCAFFWTYDPDVLGDNIRRRSILYYGSYYGGVFAERVRLTEDGMRTISEPTQITIANRYEGTNVVRRGNWFYYFGSATNCCNGPITGYSVFVGRSRSPLGPFVDRDGNTLLQGRVGGTPVLSMNGNKWVGLGHNSVFKDFDGQWWTMYHAVNRFDPYYAGERGFTKRPPLLDPLTWKNGWPNVRAGRWASTRRMPAPAAQPGEESLYRPRAVEPHRRGALLERFSDAFTGETLDPRWRWIRRPADESTFGQAGGQFRFKVQEADIAATVLRQPQRDRDRDDASILVRRAPRRDFVVQTKVSLNLPPEGCCHNYAQAGLVLYRSDDAYVKLAHVSIWETRQTEFAKEVPFDTGRDRYGNTVVGPPARTTWLRVVKETRGKQTVFTAYTRQPGERWVRGGTWVHNGLDERLRIGLVSMGLQSPNTSNFTARFDHVRTWALRR